MTHHAYTPDPKNADIKLRRGRIPLAKAEALQEEFRQFVFDGFAHSPIDGDLKGAESIVRDFGAGRVPAESLLGGALIIFVGLSARVRGFSP